MNKVCTGKFTCPVAMTEHFISKAQCSNEGFLTCRLVQCKNGLRAIASGISYTRALEFLRLGMKPILMMMMPLISMLDSIVKV